MNSINQEQIFMYFFFIGIIIAFIFTFFKCLRKHMKSSDTLIFIEDVIFLFISGLLIITNIINLNNGEFRFYMLIGIFFGIIIYSLTINKVCVIILNVLINIIFQLLNIFNNCISKCLQIGNKKDF